MEGVTAEMNPLGKTEPPEKKYHNLPDIVPNIIAPEKEWSSCAEEEIGQLTNAQPDLGDLKDKRNTKISNQKHKKYNKKKNSRKKCHTFQRGLWCTGWILCCPLFWLGSLFREPVEEDDDDWEDDPCYPCFTPPQTESR